MKKLWALVFVYVLVMANAFSEFVISPSLGYANLYSQFSIGGACYGNGGRLSLTKESEIKGKTKLNHSAFVVGLDLGGYFANGFSIFFNNNFALGGDIKSTNLVKFNLETDLGSIKGEGKTGVTLRELSGVSWTSQILLGYTKRFTDEFHLSFLTGISAGLGIFRYNEIEVKGRSVDLTALGIESEGQAEVAITVGLPLQVNFAYYFTKNVGIMLSIVDIPSINLADGAVYDFIAFPEGDLGRLRGVHQSGIGFQNMFYLRIGPSFKV